MKYLAVYSLVLLSFVDFKHFSYAVFDFMFGCLHLNKLVSLWILNFFSVCLVAISCFLYFSISTKYIFFLLLFFFLPPKRVSNFNINKSQHGHQCRMRNQCVCIPKGAGVMTGPCPQGQHSTASLYTITRMEMQMAS